MSSSEATPPTPPSVPPPGITVPSSGNPDAKVKFTVLLYEMFAAMAGLYTFMTQETLKGLNQAMQFYAKQQNIVANKLAKINCEASKSKHPGHYQAQITLLRSLQQQLQVDIGQTQSTQTAISSSVSSIASMLMSINQSVYQAMSGIVQGM